MTRSIDVVETYLPLREAHRGKINRRTVILVARSYAFQEQMLDRLQTLCDAHLKLHAERIGAKAVKRLEVRSIHNTSLTLGNTIGFEVVRGVGIRVVPGSRVRI